MEDDSGYVYEDETIEEQSSSSSGPFLTAVGVLIAIFILAAGCSAVFLMTSGTSSGDTEAIAAIETQNAIVAVTNDAVTQTIAAMETDAARPTDTPTPPPPTFTPEPSPTNTPRATNTPVVVEEVEGTEEGLEGDTPNISGTSVFENETEDSTPTPIPVGGNEGESLPDTGFELWAIALAALALVGVLIAARRMRSV